MLCRILEEILSFEANNNREVKAPEDKIFTSSFDMRGWMREICQKLLIAISADSQKDHQHGIAPICDNGINGTLYSNELKLKFT